MSEWAGRLSRLKRRFERIELLCLDCIIFPGDAYRQAASRFEPFKRLLRCQWRGASTRSNLTTPEMKLSRKAKAFNGEGNRRDWCEIHIVTMWNQPFDK